jgi:branched-chain amino acid transport system permease protein
MTSLNFFLHVFCIAGITLLPALGYNLVFGKGKILHLGQEAQSIAAVFTLWSLIMQFGMPYPFALLVAFIVTAVVSVLIAEVSFRLEPDGLGVMSIALHLALLNLVLNWQSVTRGALGMPGIPRGVLPSTLPSFAVVVFVVVVAWMLFLRWLNGGKFGRQIAALSESSWHAASLGINRRRIHTIAFLIAGMGSLFAAMLYPPFMYLLHPSDYNFPAMVFFVMCVLAGRPGRVASVAVATVMLIVLKDGLRLVGIPAEYAGPVRLILFGIILFTAVWLRRESIFPHQRRV